RKQNLASAVDICHAVFNFRRVSDRAAAGPERSAFLHMACWPFASPAAPGRLTPIRHRASTNPPQGERHMSLAPSRPAVAPPVELRFWQLARGGPSRLDEVLDLILPACPATARARPERAVNENRLIRSAYFDDKGGACLLHALYPGIRSRADRIRFFAANAILLAASEEMVIG